MNPFLSDAVVIAVIGGIVSVITTRISVQSKKHTNEILNRLDGMAEQIQDVRMDVQKVESIGNDNREGIRTTARFRLYDTMSRAIERGWTTVEEAREIGNLKKISCKSWISPFPPNSHRLDIICQFHELLRLLSIHVRWLLTLCRIA